MLTTAEKAEIVKKHGHSEGDTGSPEAQIALLTARIRDLQDHFTNNKKDNHSRRGLMAMVAKRRKLMKYLKRKNLDAYRKLIAELELRG